MPLSPSQLEEIIQRLEEMHRELVKISRLRRAECPESKRLADAMHSALNALAVLQVVFEAETMRRGGGDRRGFLNIGSN